jgi:hypothetical protein
MPQQEVIELLTQLFRPEFLSGIEGCGVHSSAGVAARFIPKIARKSLRRFLSEI